MRRIKMKDPNNDIINVADDLRAAVGLYNAETDFCNTIKLILNTVTDAIFDSLKEGAWAKDVLRALNELGNILVSQTQEYDEFEKHYSTEINKPKVDGRDPNNDIINLNYKLRSASILNSNEEGYVTTINLLLSIVNDVMFDSLKEGAASEDILIALNEFGHILVSNTKDYDEFKEC